MTGVMGLLAMSGRLGMINNRVNERTTRGHYGMVM